MNRTDDHPELKEASTQAFRNASPGSARAQRPRLQVITDSATIESWPEEKQEYYLRHVWQLGDDLFARCVCGGWRVRPADGPVGSFTAASSARPPPMP